jgi:hypothetical protein
MQRQLLPVAGQSRHMSAQRESNCDWGPQREAWWGGRVKAVVDSAGGAGKQGWLCVWELEVAVQLPS